MQFAILVAVVVAVCAEDAYNQGGRSYYAEEPYEDRDYKFSYNVQDDYTYNKQSREEQKYGNTITGQYTVLEPTGDLRVVNYVADDYGFRADVQNQEKYGPGYPQAANSYSQDSGYQRYPEPQYKAPQYNAPAPQYHAPAPQYNAPAPQYKAPEGPSYEAHDRSSYRPSYKPAPVKHSYKPAESYRPAPIYPKSAPKAQPSYPSSHY